MAAKATFLARGDSERDFERLRERDFDFLWRRLRERERDRERLGMVEEEEVVSFF